MARCNECNSVITKTDSECYICGLAVPGAKMLSLRRKKEPKPTPPVTPLSNLLFIASLALTLVSFLSSQKMSVGLSATLSGTLLIARIFSDRMASKQSLALRPVPITRLHY
jgi:hypothetical protein